MSENTVSRDELRNQIRQKIHNNNADGKEFYVIPVEDNTQTESGKPKRVCAYCRVSTDDPAQTTSYELQKTHYEKQINETAGWKFAGIYADEGISATSLKNRDDFNRMIADCYAGKIDIIVTKNVSRFARNVVDCLSVVRKLAQLNPPVCVKFENEGFDSLSATSELLLTVLAASAQEESKTKSNSMQWSLEKRFDNFNFLTPVLLGYDHDKDGNLVVNPYEANTVRLMFYSYLAGFPLDETARLLNELKRPSKKGNIKWNPAGIRSILRNERYYGAILSWKTYTYDFWEHKKRKNRQNRKQILVKDHHEAIVSEEIFKAVQTKLELDKYTNEPHNYPSLSVVDDGVLQGFVSVNRSCRGFTEKDYYEASKSIYSRQEIHASDQPDRPPLEDPELDGYIVTRAEFFSLRDKPLMTINRNKISFNAVCLKCFEDVEFVELLINTVDKCIAIRPCDEKNPNAFRWGKMKEDRWRPSPKSITGFAAPLFAITGWDPTDKVKLCGQCVRKGKDKVLFFDLLEPEIIRLVPEEDNADIERAAASDVDHIEDNAVSAESSDDGSEAKEEVEVMKLETVIPDSWHENFGSGSENRYTWYFERVRYDGSWEILRPARFYAYAGNFQQELFDEVRRETHRIIEEMRCAV